MKRKRIRGKLIVWVALGVLTLVLVILCRKEWIAEIPLRIDRVVDGDTITLTNGKTVKLAGVDFLNGDRENSFLAKQYLEVLLKNRNIWLENGRSGVLVWVGCESTPRFWVLRSKGENPFGCKKGALANEQILKMSWPKEK